MRMATNAGLFSTFVSIYQAGESLYQPFEKVCVLYEGRMTYFGRADQARQYFLDLGFEPAHRQTTADFLVAGMLISYAVFCLKKKNYCYLVTDPTARIVHEDFKGR